jgi:hypothetical protein
MIRLLILSRRNSIQEWEYIAKRLTISDSDSIQIVSGFAQDGDLSYMPTFYQQYYHNDTAAIALKEIGELNCQEIIQRCRLLRNLRPDFAIKIVGAMWFSLNEIVDHSSPDIIISSLVDFFVPDILQRVIERRGGQFIGIARSILSNRVILTARGEFNWICKPSNSEIESALQEILEPNFSPSINKKAKYNLCGFIDTQVRWNLRWLWFDFLRVTQNDFLQPEYMMTPKPGDDYYISLSDWHKIEKSIDRDWRNRILSSNFSKRVFIGLQYTPECTTDYWVNDLDMANWINSLEAIVKILSTHQYTIFVKDHPMMYGLRKSDVFESLKKYKNVCFVPYEVRSQELIELCKTVFTWTGTIAVQAALMKRCPVIVNSYYANEKDFVSLPTVKAIDLLPSYIEGFLLPDNIDEVGYRIAKKICQCTVPGQIQLTGFSLKNEDHRIGANFLVDSLNKNLYHFYKEKDNST